MKLARRAATNSDAGQVSKDENVIVAQSQPASNAPAPRRQAVLIAVHPDGYLEAFADKSVDVRFARHLDFNRPAGEELAEQCFEMLLPQRYRDLWRRDRLRATGTTDLLRPQAALAAVAAKDCIAALEPFMPPKEKREAA